MKDLLAVTVLGLFVIVAGILLSVVMALVMAWPVVLLWNAVIPDITREGLPPITYWQALGLLLLCDILFKASVTANTANKDKD